MNGLQVVVNSILPLLNSTKEAKVDLAIVASHVHASPFVFNSSFATGTSSEYNLSFGFLFLQLLWCENGSFFDNKVFNQFVVLFVSCINGTVLSFIVNLMLFDSILDWEQSLGHLEAPQFVASASELALLAIINEPKFTIWSPAVSDTALNRVDVAWTCQILFHCVLSENV